MLAAQAIGRATSTASWRGGMESMSNAPHYVYGCAAAIKAGNSQLVDGMILDGLWDSSRTPTWGNLAEYTAKKAGVSREDQDRFRARQPPEGRGGDGGVPLQAEMVATLIESRTRVPQGQLARGRSPP